MKRKFTVVALVAAMTLTGCGKYNNARGDAPVGDKNEAPRKVWNNVDSFPNIVAFCIGNDGAYTTTRQAAPVIISDDPNCAEGGILRS